MAPPLPLNKWKNAAKRVVAKGAYAESYLRAQRIKARVEDAVAPFFSELVKVGIDVTAAPQLEEFTPSWKPLIRKWVNYKAKHGKSPNFFAFGGGLRAALSRRTTRSTFGNVQVDLHFGDVVTHVTARPPAQKYSGLLPLRATVVVNPFPKVDIKRPIEDQIFSLGEETDFNLTLAKLMNAGSGANRQQRPLLTPFFRWFMKYRVKQAMRGSI